MAGTRPHTREYSEEARRRLGLAVVRAREAMGHQFRPSFVKLLPIGMRSLIKLEDGTPVGASVYEAVAKVIPTWIDETPRIILEGGPIPSNDGIADEVSTEPRKPVIADAEIAAMDRISVRKHYFFLEKEYGEEEADDWLVHAAQVRRDARRAARGPLATDGV